LIKVTDIQEALKPASYPQTRLLGAVLLWQYPANAGFLINFISRNFHKQCAGHLSVHASFLNIFLNFHFDKASMRTEFYTSHDWKDFPQSCFCTVHVKPWFSSTAHRLLKPGAKGHVHI
jgi:hypothetical protein